MLLVSPQAWEIKSTGFRAELAETAPLKNTAARNVVDAMGAVRIRWPV